MSFLSELVNLGASDAKKSNLVDFAMDIGAQFHDISLGNSGFLSILKSLTKIPLLETDAYLPSVLNSSEMIEIEEIVSRVAETVVGSGTLTPNLVMSRILYSIVRDYDSSIPALAHALKHGSDSIDREGTILNLLVDITSGDALSPEEWDAAEIALTDHFKLPVAMVGKIKAMLIEKWEGVSTAYTI